MFLFSNIFNSIVSAEQVEIKEENSSGIGIYLDQDMFVPFSMKIVTTPWGWQLNSSGLKKKDFIL